MLWLCRWEHESTQLNFFKVDDLCVWFDTTRGAIVTQPETFGEKSLTISGGSHRINNRAYRAPGRVFMQLS